MPTHHKNRWELSMKADLENFLIPEPQHRSDWDQLVSVVESLCGSCLCHVPSSGKYENNKLAARYVHQMAEEVMSQLSGVSAEIDVVGANVELMKTRIKEWEENFPSTLTEIGHPKAIADLISKQKKKIADLQSKLEMEKKVHDKDVNDVLRSMNVQLQAARNSTFLERQQLSLAHQQDEEENKQRLTIRDHEHQRNIDALKKEHREETSRIKQTLQQQYDASISALKEDATHRVATVKTVYENELLKLRKRYTNDIATLEDHIQVLEEKLVHIHIELNGDENIDDLEIPSYELEPLRVSSFNPEQLAKLAVGNSDGSAATTESNGSLCTSVQEEFVLRSPGTPTRSARDIISQLNVPQTGSPSKFAAHSNQLSECKRENRLLRTKYKELTWEYKTLEKTISALSDERKQFNSVVDEWKQNHENSMKRLSQLEAINDQLRSALKATCERNDFNPGDLWAKQRPLQHTADFLQRADTSGLQ